MPNLIWKSNLPEKRDDSALPSMLVADAPRADPDPADPRRPAAPADAAEPGAGGGAGRADLRLAEPPGPSLPWRPHCAYKRRAILTAWEPLRLRDGTAQTARQEFGPPSPTAGLINQGQSDEDASGR